MTHPPHLSTGTSSSALVEAPPPSKAELEAAALAFHKKQQLPVHQIPMSEFLGSMDAQRAAKIQESYELLKIKFPGIELLETRVTALESNAAQTAKKGRL